MRMGFPVFPSRDLQRPDPPLDGPRKLGTPGQFAPRAEELPQGISQTGPLAIFNGESEEEEARPYIIGHNFPESGREGFPPSPCANGAKSITAKMYSTNVSYVTFRADLAVNLISTGPDAGRAAAQALGLGPFVRHLSGGV